GEVKSPRIFCPYLMLDQASTRWEEHVGRDRRNDDEVELGRVDTPSLKSHFSSFSGQVTCRRASFHDMTFADAGSFDNRLVRGIDRFFKFLICNAALRKVMTDSCDFCTT